MNQIIITNNGIRTVSYDYETNLNGNHYAYYDWMYGGSGSINFFYDDTVTKSDALRIFFNKLKEQHQDLLDYMKNNHMNSCSKAIKNN